MFFQSYSNEIYRLTKPPQLDFYSNNEIVNELNRLVHRIVEFDKEMNRFETYLQVMYNENLLLFH